MAVLEELLTRLGEWFHQLQKDAPMDLWLQALVLLVFCVGFNATSWLLTPKKGTTASSSPAELPEQFVQVKETPSVAKATKESREDVRSVKTPTVESESPSSLEVRPIFTFDGLDFDGDRIVNLREKPYYFDQHLGGAMSISFIARWDAFALRSRIIDFGDGPTADNIIIANLETGRSLIVEVFRGPSKKRLTMPGSLAIGETHRYLLSISETGLMRMLQDGSQLGVQPQGYAPRTLERRKLLVGGSNWSSDENFQGEISELKIWPREVSWKEAFPVETPLPPPRLPPKEEPEEREEQKPEKQVEDEEVQTEPLPELAQESQPPDEDEEGWTAVSKPRTKAEKRAKAEARKPVQVPSPPPPPRRNSGASSTTSATPSVPPPPEPTKHKGRGKGEGKSFPTVAVSSAPVAAPVMPPTPPAPPVHEEAEKPKETKESKEQVEVTETKESKQELAEKKRGKAWADIPPEGTPPNSPPNTGLVLTEVQTPQEEILESPAQNGASVAETGEDAGFEVLTGKRRPKVAPEVVLGPGDRPKVQESSPPPIDTSGDRPKVQESSPPPIDTSGTTSPSKGQQTTTPSTLSPLEKEILRLEKKQREVEKLKQRQADGEELDHLQRKKLLCEDEMTQKLAELHLKKALLKAPQVTHHEGDGGSPEPWDLPKVPVAPAMGQPSAGSVTRTPLRAPREGSFRPGLGGETQLSSGAEIFTPASMANAEVPFAMQMPQMALVDGVGDMMNDVPEETWDACWEWVQNGYCPRGETCRWDHPALQFPDGSVALWPGSSETNIQPTEQVFVMVPAENFPCQGAPPNMAPGSWSGPYAGDQITMPCGVGVPMAPMGPTVGPTAVAPVTMLPTGNPCDPMSGCGCAFGTQSPAGGDSPFNGDALLSDGQPAR